MLQAASLAYYSFSTTVCTPSALSQEGGMSLGAQAGEARLKKVAMDAGFSRFRRATETPFNLSLEARPCGGRGWRSSARLRRSFEQQGPSSAPPGTGSRRLRRARLRHNRARHDRQRAPEVRDAG